MDEEHLSIAEAAQRFAISADTLRYYEKVGLVTSHRRPSGIRYYNQEDVSRLEFVKCMRDAGVSVEALIHYLQLFAQGDSTIAERKALLIEQRDELLKKKALIEQSLKRLDYKIDNYDSLLARKRDAK